MRALDSFTSRPLLGRLPSPRGWCGVPLGPWLGQVAVALRLYIPPLLPARFPMWRCPQARLFFCGPANVR